MSERESERNEKRSEWETCEDSLMGGGGQRKQCAVGVARGAQERAGPRKQSVSREKERLASFPDAP